jgi:hypothetical protein
MKIAKVLQKRHIDELLKKHTKCSYRSSIAQYYKDAKIALEVIEEAWKAEDCTCPEDHIELWHTAECLKQRLKNE